MVSGVPFEVSTPVYEGPFDLLLHLITKEQVDLYEISLSRIVDAFLAEIERMHSLDLEVATEFLLIAATLVELKLRRLMPERGNVEMDEELALLEERDLLLAKLLEYQTFRQAAEVLRRLETRASRSHARTNVLEERFTGLTPDPLAGATPKQLRDAFLRVVNRLLLPKDEPRLTLDHVTAVKLTVAEAVAELADQLPALKVATFRSLVPADAPPLELIVRFLAVLELFKQGWVELDQTVSFGELLVTWCPDGPETDVDDAVSATGAIAPGFAPVEGADRSLDDAEDEEAEAELEAALADVRSGAAPGARDIGDEEIERLAQVRPAVSLDVDDYEG